MDEMTYQDTMPEIRSESVRIAGAILDGSAALVGACKELARLGSWWTAHEEEEDWRGVHDQDFDVFKRFLNETREHPFGDVRQHWNSEALSRKNAQLAEYVAANREAVLAGCRRLLDKFSAVP